jgi:hypothetical protein
VPGAAWCAVLVVASACSVRPDQKQNLVSPNGEYVVCVPIEPAALPRLHRAPVWTVTIKDRRGRVLFRDDESAMVGNLNVYWAWDERNRVWVYNSDNGKVFKYESKDGQWHKQEATGDKDVPRRILQTH